jgi:hypothetical protein
MPTTPSRPTTALAAEALSAITSSRDTMAVVEN